MATTLRGAIRLRVLQIPCYMSLTGLLVSVQVMDSDHLTQWDQTACVADTMLYVSNRTFGLCSDDKR